MWVEGSGLICGLCDGNWDLSHLLYTGNINSKDNTCLESVTFRRGLLGLWILLMYLSFHDT